MQTLRIIALSVLAGCIAGGFVWYLWGLVENVRSFARRPRAAVPETKPEP